MEPLLEAKSLKKSFRVFNRLWFDWRHVVKDVSLFVNEGEIVCLLGPNGAGKSTSLKMICGGLKPDAGSVFLNGQEVTNWPMYRRCHAGLGYLSQENSLFRNLSVENNLLSVMQLLGYRKQECRDRCDELMEMFDLTRLRNSKASGLSGGERRRLEVARALTKDPKLIILDEPFAGVDPKVIEKVQDLIRSLHDKLGIAILITDHNVMPVLDISHRGYVVADGQVIFEGDVKDLIKHPKVRAVYLGSKAVPLGYTGADVIDPGFMDYGDAADEAFATENSGLKSAASVPVKKRRPTPDNGLDLSDNGFVAGQDSRAMENAPESSGKTTTETGVASSLLSDFRDSAVSDSAVSSESPTATRPAFRPERVAAYVNMPDSASCSNEQTSAGDGVMSNDPVELSSADSAARTPRPAIRPFRRKP